MSAEPAKNGSGGRPGKSAKALSAARLAAVQALYEMDATAAPSDPVLEEFLRDRWRQPGAGEEALDSRAMTPPDQKLLTELVSGVGKTRPELDAQIGAGLQPPHTVESIEMLLRAVLRAGTFELVHRLSVPAKVVIAEYMDVAHAFFAEREPSLVNGVLDHVAHAVRPGELAPPAAKAASAADTPPST